METKSLSQVCRPSVCWLCELVVKARTKEVQKGVWPSWCGKMLVWGRPHMLLVVGAACILSGSPSACLLPTDTLCLALAPACTHNSVPLLMTSTRSCPSWGPLSSPQQGKGTSSVGRRTPSAVGPCKPSRLVPSYSYPAARIGCSAFMPRTSVLDILGGMTSALSSSTVPGVG
jgi:hypothetical protein